MSVADVISLLGGIALFLFGMSLMGEGLKKVAGSRLELVLYKLSSTPLKGVLLGTGVTAVIQSSSATSVMVVGFVNSGMMKVKQAIGVIMGAILGTSVTGWILCLSSLEGGSGVVQLLSTEVLTGIVAVVGIILRMFTGKSQQPHHVGEILLGFAVLMYGMSAMSGAVSPLRESEAFIRILTSFSNPHSRYSGGSGCSPAFCRAPPPRWVFCRRWPLPALSPLRWLCPSSWASPSARRCLCCCPPWAPTSTASAPPLSIC